MDCRPLRTVLYFEELEPRLLYSADLAGAIPAEVPEQDLDEEPVVTADLENTEESDAAQQEEDEESDPSTLSESSAGDAGAVEETEEVEEATGTEPLPDTAAEETSPADTPLGSSAEENERFLFAPPPTTPMPAPVITMPDTAVSYAPGERRPSLRPSRRWAMTTATTFFRGRLR